MITTVDHKDGYKVLLDTSTGHYYDLRNVPAQNLTKKLLLNGRFFDYCETINDFDLSKKRMAVIPCFCKKTGDKGKRTYARFISGNETIEFYNVERIGEKWVKNEIDNLTQRSAFFVCFKKHPDAINAKIITETFAIVLQK